jgi:hypothetical protein
MRIAQESVKKKIREAVFFNLLFLRIFSLFGDLFCCRAGEGGREKIANYLK